jgi:hypothetical protein
MVDSLFQGQTGMGGTHNAIMSSEEYLSTAQRNFNNLEEGYYISPAFLDKVFYPALVNICVNIMCEPPVSRLVRVMGSVLLSQA